MFEVTNETTGQTVVLEDDGFAKLKQAIDIPSAEMLEKANKETDPKKRKMMLLYARRKREIEAELTGKEAG